MSVNDHYIKSARRYLAEEDMDRAKELYERISARSECEDEARIAVLLCEYWEVRLTGYSKNYLPKVICLKVKSFMKLSIIPGR